MIITDTKNQKDGLVLLAQENATGLQGALGSQQHAGAKIKIWPVSKVDVLDMKKKYGLKINGISKKYNDQIANTKGVAQNPVDFLRSMGKCAKYLKNKNSGIIVKFEFNSMVFFAIVTPQLAKQLNKIIMVLELMQNVNPGMMANMPGGMPALGEAPSLMPPQNDVSASASSSAMANNNWWMNGKDEKDNTSASGPASAAANNNWQGNNRNNNRK
jgi:hypothetical protein